VTVYERAPVLEAAGAGLSLWPNAVHALRDLGVAEAVEAADVPRGQAGLWRWDGRPLALDSAEALGERFGAPLVLLHRSEIQAALLGALPTGTVVLGETLERVEQDDAGVQASFAGGRRVTADLLVGADGLRSTVRETVLGPAPPRYSGLVAFRAVVADAPGGLVGECWGHPGVFGVAPLSGGHTYWYATDPAEDPEARASAAETHALLRERFAGWADPIPALVERTPPERILRHPLFDRPPQRGWSDGRVTLLGDAAHPMLPFLGQGACQAIEDAVALRDALRGEAPVVDALAAYERARYGRTAAIVKRSGAAGRIAHLPRAWQRRVRDGLMARTPEPLRRRQLAATLVPG
jgi:2-polyprenyl-6-methoxyphenol hydroxylase-like FAD-dependent oxidoreductase